MAFDIPDYLTNSMQRTTLLAQGSYYTTQLNAAAQRYGCVFKARVSENMTGFKFASGTNAGTVTNIAQADLYAVDSNGYPTGASLAAATFTPANSSTNTVTWGTPYAVTAGTCYAVVLSNLDGAPTTNKYGVGYCGSNYLVFNETFQYANNLWLASIDSGTTWEPSAVLPPTKGGSLVFAPIYDTFGTDCQAMIGTEPGVAYTTTLLYNAADRKARLAVRVNLPCFALLRSVAVSFAAKAGSPAYALVGEVCSATASLSVSTSAVTAAASSNLPIVFWWDSPYRLSPGVDYYIGVTPSEVGNGASGTTARLNRNMPILKTPTIGPMYESYESTASPGPTWSEVATYCFAVGIGLEIPAQQVGTVGP